MSRLDKAVIGAFALMLAGEDPDRPRLIEQQANKSAETD